MKKRPFKFWHSVAGTLALIVAELIVMHFSSLAEVTIGAILVASVVGAIVTIYVATEVIEEVRGAFPMIMLLSAIVAQFVIFFTFQYFFLLQMQPASFPTLSSDVLSLLLHSVMIFVFNPLYLPGTAAGRALLLIQTFGALGLAFFVLQNIGEFRKKSLDKTT